MAEPLAVAMHAANLTPLALMDTLGVLRGFAKDPV
jgi:hypothetical protein